MEFVKVKKGNLETKILVKQLNHYLKNGWVKVEVEEVEQPDTYDAYTKKQLIDICENRKLVVKSNDTKKDIVTKLLKQDGIIETILNKPTNKGFTDNLIIE